MNRAELKASARESIRGKIGILFLIWLIISVISSVAGGLLSLVPFGGIIASVVVTPAFALSVVRVYLDVVKGNTPDAGDAFSGFDDFWSAFKVQFFVGLFTFLWSLLFFIPGIVKSYSYSMSMYILADNPGKGALECIKESQKMTDGHKMDLFVLHLSFIGWILVGCLTLGIALIWVVPHMSAAYANAYNSLKPAPAQVITPEVEEPTVEA